MERRRGYLRQSPPRANGDPVARTFLLARVDHLRSDPGSGGDGRKPFQPAEIVRRNRFPRLDLERMEIFPRSTTRSISFPPHCPARRRPGDSPMEEPLDDLRNGERLEQRTAHRMDREMLPVFHTDEPSGKARVEKKIFGVLTIRFPKFRKYGGRRNTMWLASRTVSQDLAVLCVIRNRSQGRERFRSLAPSWRRTSAGTAGRGSTRGCSPTDARPARYRSSRSWRTRATGRAPSPARGIHPFEQEIVDGQGHLPRRFQLLDRKREQLDDRHASGERLRDLRKETELLRSGQHEETGTPVEIHPRLDVGKQGRAPLGLIENSAIRIQTKEPSGSAVADSVWSGSSRDTYGFSGNVARTSVVFPRLSRPGYRENRVPCGKFPQDVHRSSFNHIEMLYNVNVICQSDL